MAAKTSFRRYSTQESRLGGTSNMDVVTPELHLKMSKKIAQLTKVIYALNTRNDDHDMAIQRMKEQNEEKIQQIVSENRQKLEQYAVQIQAEVEIKKDNNVLQAEIAEHEFQKKKAYDDFERFKKQIADRETKQKIQHSQAVLGLTTEMMKMKEDFNNRLDEFDDMKTLLAQEKKTTLDDLEQGHRAELDRLHSEYSSRIHEEGSEIVHKLRTEIDTLTSKLSMLNEDKSKLCDDYECKLKKAQAFYDNELLVARNAGDSTREVLEKSWKMKETDLRNEFGIKENQSQRKIIELQCELNSCETELEDYKEKLAKTTAKLEHFDSNSDKASDELTEARNETLNAQKKIYNLQTELLASQERCKEQAEEMVRMSHQLGVLEATKMINESTLKDLNSELNKLKDKLSWLENEKASLLEQSMTLTVEQDSRLNALQQALEDLSTDKQLMKERFEKRIETDKTNSTKNLDELGQKYESDISAMRAESKSVAENVKRKNAEELKNTTEKLNDNFEKERQNLKSEMDKYRSTLDQSTTEFSSKLSAVESERERLQKLVNDHEQGLGSASSHIESLNTMNNKLRKDLESTQSQLCESQSALEILKLQLEKLKLDNKKQCQSAKDELHLKLKEQCQNLEQKWTDTLRKECEKLRKELNNQHSEDSRAALEQLRHLKDSEMEKSKSGWDLAKRDLSSQIIELRASLQRSSQQTQSESDRLRTQYEADKKLLTEQMMTSATEYAERMEEMRKCHEEEIKKLTDQMSDEQSKIEKKLNNEHTKDLEVQLIAHNIVVNKLKLDTDHERITALENQKKEFDDAIAALRNELTDTHSLEIDQHSKGFRTQIQAARLELERVVELKDRQGKEDLNKMEDLNDTIGKRQEMISKLEARLSALTRDVDRMVTQLEQKSDEILKIRSDSNNKLKKTEKELEHNFRNRIESIQLEHIHETESLMEEFTKAQDIMKEKIDMLRQNLAEAEERYEKRESRPDDLDLINQLRDTLAEREQIMNKLIEEKGYYQRELVNRETNYNKVFNTAPQVGVINPLQKAKKGGAKIGFGSRNNSVPTLSSAVPTRLDPIPNSPIHDQRINNNHPLPDPPHGIIVSAPHPPTQPKKFLK